LPALDRVFQGLVPGDNFVWQVESLRDFKPLVAPLCRSALARGRKVVYFRFAAHQPLLPKLAGVTVHRLRTDQGFERFLVEVHRVIHTAGRGAYLVFDCLSTLVEAWCSDRMLANFFLLTSAYVRDHRCLAYFPLLRNVHSFHASTPIAETAQVVVELYRHQGQLYVHPTKVEGRYRPTMYMLHRWEGDDFRPLTESSMTAEILTSRPWAGLESIRLRLGKWARTFLQAEETWQGIRHGERPAEDAARLLPDLIHMAISREPRVARLVARHLTLPDLLEIWRRMIGTGLIGGKSVGMLLARAILKQAGPQWSERLEAHDSFFVGADVFYSFLVENDCWWLRQKQRDPNNYLDNVDEARRRILTGRFPDYLVKEFAEMLDYYGQSPIIVRSSSLLEDNYGNAFAGKYESVFCANQGPHAKRLQDFLSAVRLVYASSMSEKALQYRAQRGLLDRDEQMSLLVQRVSGGCHGSLFFPQVAGVALSRNPYVWSAQIDPAAGMVRLVFGLGTRAVDRWDDDYTRIVALNAPDRRPESDFDEVRQFSQRKVDVIDLEANQPVSYDFHDVAAASPDLPLEVFASRDGRRTDAGPAGGPVGPSGLVLTFDELLSRTPFVAEMRELLRILQEAYDYPVDCEFTANFLDPERYKINLVQCRPLQVTAEGDAVELPQDVRREDCILEARGAVIGRSRASVIDRLVYVPPAVYGQLPLRERYSVARLIGRLTHLRDSSRPAPSAVAAKSVLLIGPGRWGTTTPSLGVPVHFAEINTVSVLCEIVAMRDDLVPDVSLGTHFFNDLVENDMLYLALFPNREGNFWNDALLQSAPNRLAELLPDDAQWSKAVRVIDLRPAANLGAVARLTADAIGQQVICYLDRPEN
jgi:hypothetical protein